MDKRKLELYGMQAIDLFNGDGPIELHEIITRDGSTGDFDTVALGFEDQSAPEIVKRYNAYPELVKWLEAITGRLRELDEHLSDTERTEACMAEALLEELGEA